MSHFNEPVPPHDNLPYSEPSVLDTAVPPEQELPIRRLRRVLRGRGGWAVGVFLIGALGMGVVGWFSAPRMYRSTAIANVQAYVPSVLQREGNLLPMYESYLEGQEAVVQSSRVIDMALSSEAWKQTGLGQDSEMAAKFVDSLTVKRIGEMITITFEHPRPEVAMAGAQAVIGAYKQIYTEQDAKSQDDRINLLQDRRNNLTSQLNSQRDRIAALAGDLGPEGLERIHQFKVDEDARIESQLRGLELSITLAKGRARNPETQPVTSPLNDTPPLKVLAVTDPNYFQALWQRHQALASQLDQLKGRYGNDHRSVKDVQEQLNLVEADAQNLAQLMKDRGIDPVTGTTGGRTPVEDLETQYKELKALYDKSQEQVKNLGKTSLQIQTIQSEMARTQQNLDETKQRLDQLNVEAVVSGRLKIVSEGDRPMYPSSDKRRQRAILGSAGGGLLGFGLVVLLGLMDRRIRSSDDARACIAPAALLGTLPHLPQDLSDQLHARLAAQSVHHIRAVLQVSLGPLQKHVLAVSSSSAGAGKTSLTLAMGLSYAESGARVLLIDGDLHGGGLTRRLGAIVRGRLGRMLISRGRLTHEQLDEALDRAQSSKRRLGEVLLEQGVVTSKELDEVLSAQQEGRSGLLEALSDGELTTYVAPTGTPSLFILPRGQASEADASRVSLTALDHLVAQAREQFDVVIMDTGPIVGSVESSLLCAAADNVLLVMARGEDRHMVERALTMLQAVNGHLAGIVYNRADAKDFDRSVYSYKSIRMSMPTEGATPFGLQVAGGAGATPAVGRTRSVAGALVTGRPPTTGS